MFAIHVSNPFTAKSRDAARDEEAKAKHLEERDQREATRRAAYLSEQRMMKNFNDLSVTDSQGKKQRNLAERAKYQFEADSEDEEMENEIDDNLDMLSGVTGRLNALARATGKEVNEQNERLKIIEGKVCLSFNASHRSLHANLLRRATRSILALLPTGQGWTASNR